MRIFFVIEIKLLSFFSELASSIIMLFLLTPQIKNTLLLSRQITTLATAEHAHFMAYVKHLLKQHTYAYASLAKQMSRLHCATTMTSHTRTCKYNYHVCQTQEEPGIKHYGRCKRESLPVL